MKKILPITLLLITGVTTFTACSGEEDDIFDQSAAERLNHVSNLYSQRLCSSTGGWVMEYFPYGNNEDEVTGNGYLIMNRFHTNGSVYSLMRNGATNNNLVEDSTAWEIITDMGPVLTYNTWNACLSLFADPNDIPTTGSDEEGKGYQGDYEFVMVDVPENPQHIMLKGKKRGLYHRLTRLPEGTDFAAYLDSIDAFKQKMFPSNARWELLMTNNETKYNMNFLYRGNPTIYPERTDSVTTGWREPYLITHYDGKYHLRFKDTTVVAGKQLEQEFAYIPEEDIFRGIQDSENIITGDTVSRFFLAAVDRGNNWQLTRNSQMSESIKALYDKLYNDMRANSYSLSNIVIINSAEGQISISYRYTYNRKNYNTVYPMLYARSGQNITFTLETEKIIGKLHEVFPAIDEVNSFICQNIQCLPALTQFNLNTVKLQSDQNAADWAIFTLR